MTSSQLDTMARHYFIAALWSTNNIDIDNDIETSFSDLDYTTTDINTETYTKGKEDCKEFIDIISNHGLNIDDILNKYDIGYDDLGHTFWLLRNGHGCTFHDYVKLPTQLANILNSIANKFYHEFYGYVDMYGQVIFE